MNYLIGIDCGTSATKTILMDEDGNIISRAFQKYPLYEPDNGWAEQDPEDWKSAALNTIKQVVATSGVSKENIRGIGISGQMHGLVMLDENGDVLRKSIIWCDQRSHEQLKEMLRRMPYERWLEITANPPIAAWTVAKYLWVKENEPELLEKCRHILLPKDYLRHVLTGEFATEVSDASGTQMMDLKNRCWSDEVLSVLGIKKSMLGKLYESQEITGYLLPEIADYCGLTTETAVVGGGADNACAAIGTGVGEDGDALTTIGTSGLVYTHMDNYRPVPEGSLHLCCSAVPGAWFTMGGPQAAGLSIEWFKNNFCGGLMREAEASGADFFDLMQEKIKRIAPGSEHLIYMPFLMGERTPHLNPKMRGAFIGLNAIHTEAHLFRSIMEGITYSLADCNNILKGLGVFVRQMKVCGGGSRNPVWRQIMADLYDCEIVAPEREEGPSFGAAILAGAGTGVYSNLKETAKRLAKCGESVKPIPNEVEVYKKYHALYNSLYRNLEADFTTLYEI